MPAVCTVLPLLSIASNLEMNACSKDNSRAIFREGERERGELTVGSVWWSRDGEEQ